MMTIAEALTLAFQHHQGGNLPQAEQLYREILQVDPDNADALNLLGVLALQVGQQQQALDHIGQAVRLKPNEASFQSNLGLVYQSLGQGHEASACFREALRLQPDFAEAHNNLGNILKDQGQRQDAVACFRRALELLPEYYDAHYNLGNALQEQGQWDQAIASYRAALRLRPDAAEPHNNLGNIFLDQGRLNEAIASFQEALRLRPDFPEAHNNLGNALRSQGRLDDAIARFRQALQLWPNYPKLHNNLGNTLRDQGRLGEAVVCFRQALDLQPDLAAAHNNLGITLQDLGRLEEAIASFRQALEFRPSLAEAHTNLGNALREQGRLDEAEARLRQACRLKPADPTMHGNLLMCLNYAPHSTPASLRDEHRRWAEQHGRPAASAHANDPDPGRRLRVGYVSPDLRQHPVAAFLEPILAHHDPMQVEVFCYAEVSVPDAVTARLRSLAHGWRTTSGLSDAQVAALIGGDGIDLLVDLAGHTGHSRLLVFAPKPAPVQLTYLGYPSTTGLPAIDYRLTDAVADPPGEPASHTEELWRLPGCFCCYAPLAGAPAVAAAPAARRGHVTFGSFHNLAKLNARVLELWCRLLHAVPAARLLVCHHSLAGQGCERVRQELEQGGIDADRFELRQGALAGSLDHLGLYAEVDVLLDTFPWGGHTTTCEALWMGVPVLTLSGDRHAGRMVSSVLHCLHLAEWVAPTPEEYVERGVRLTHDVGRLVDLRQALRDAMRVSPLCDGLAFTRRLEEAYRTIWQRWCAGRAKH